MLEDRQVGRPTIPTNILVHLGRPEEAAKDVEVSFIDYIKNVACSELYPTWPEAAIRSNVLAQISFALNRVYTEHYKARGYRFDITSLPSYDQTYKHGRDLFENIARIVDEIFNNYLVKGDKIEPFFASYCDGKNTLCKGLSQWGTVSLAEQGKTPLEILRYYYGDDVHIIQDAVLSEPISSYPGKPLQIGDVSEHLLIIKRQLNRIALNYPALSTFTTIHEFFDILTEEAIKKFQEIFDLDVTGILDKATWYKIKYLYTATKKLSDLYTEGILSEEIETPFQFELKEKDTGTHVRSLHYYLGVIAYFDENVPLLETDSQFTENTKEMVIAFQNEYQLPATGVVNTETWNKIDEVYHYVITHLPQEVMAYQEEIFPGKLLSLGMRGDEIKHLQQLLLKLHEKDSSYLEVDVWGCFDTKTELAVKHIQKLEGLDETGAVGAAEWYSIVERTKRI